MQPPSVKVGDRVVFSKYGYDEIKINGIEYFILKEDSILAVIKK
jgi:chaperonin GroES